MYSLVRYERASRPDLRILITFSNLEISATEDSAVKQAYARPEGLGKAGAIAEAWPPSGIRTVVVGLGAHGAVSAKDVAKAAKSLHSHISKTEATSVLIDVDREISNETARLIGEALATESWDRMLFAGSAAKPKKGNSYSVSATDEQFSKALIEGLAIGNCANWTRTLVETPPNIATPEFIAEEAAKMAAEFGMSCHVVRGEELRDKKMAGLITVGGASTNPPCLIRIEYAPPGTESEPAIVLLGKTITYDTGGLSLKTREGMSGMKGDKAGGCAVLGAMRALAEVVQPNCRVVGLLVAAENSVAGNAYRPDDVIEFGNGVTVEVTNTDAEGRLVLADGLIWAGEYENATQVIDMATLTGGVVVALGRTFAGLFSNDDEFALEIQRAGDSVWERSWRLPLDEEYSEMMRSEVADILNSNPNRRAHPIQGASFLQYFVADGMKWVHLDIAGVASTDKSGPSGFGVRLLAQLFRDRS